MRYDVIVIGAGPAGSTAARECAQYGLRTLMLDRAVFPRDKPCGGGVNVRAARLLPFDLLPVTERSIYGMRVSVRQGPSFVRRAPQPISFLTQRRRLDAYLAERAVAAGAEFVQRATVHVVERENRSVTVRADGGSYAAGALVIADGANGPSARLAGITVERTREIALEGNITTSDTDASAWHDLLGIDLGGVPGGYGWLFPKGDHVNIGVGGWNSIGPTARSRMHSLARFYGFDPDGFWGVRGHPLPVRRPGATLVDGNVMLAGDAAGLLDPLSGEGIFAAIWSGRTAARHLVPYLNGRSESLTGYRCDVERELAADLAVARQLHALFHTVPGVWARFVEHSPRAWRLICALVAGDATYAGVRDRSRLVALGLDTGMAGLRFRAYLRQRDPRNSTRDRPHFLA